jgi:hypothetical protein
MNILRLPGHRDVSRVRPHGSLLEGDPGSCLGSLEHPHGLNLDLLDAQRGRRIYHFVYRMYPAVP